MSTAQPSRIQIGARFLFNLVVAPALLVVAAVAVIWLLGLVGII